MNHLLIDILEGFLGDYKKHNEDTGQISFDCPACSADKGMPQGDNRGNLEINYESCVFKCWSCKDTNNMQGPISRLLIKWGGGKSLKAWELIKPANQDSKERIKKIIEVRLPESHKLLSTASPKDYRYTDAMRYLQARGITEHIIEEFQIGFTSSGQFYNRIIIPSYNPDGILTYFIARWFDKKYTKLKYINPEAEKQEIVFNEGKVNWDATIYLVEGATDHIVTPNSIPLLGKYLSPLLLDMLYEKANSHVVICLDGDAHADAVYLYKQLNFGKLRGRIKLAKPKSNLDPSKTFELEGPSGIIRMLKTARALKEHEIY